MMHCKYVPEYYMCLARKKQNICSFLGGSKAEGRWASVVMGFKQELLLLWHGSIRKFMYDFKERIEA